MALFDRILGAAVVAAATPLFAPDPVCRWRGHGLTPASAASVSAADAAFAVRAAELGLGEILLSRLAVGRSGDQSVLDFARRMIDEHDRANAELARLCAGKRVVVPMTAARPDRDERDRLDTVADDAFDAAYAARMVADHERAVALFRLQADQGADTDLRSFAIRHLPALEDHLAAARMLATDAGTRKGRGKSPRGG